MRRPIFLAVGIAVAGMAVASNTIEIKTSTGNLLVDSKMADIVGVYPIGQTNSVWHSGEYGLWRLKFKDNITLEAADFRTNGCPVTVVRMADGSVTASFSHPSVDVKVVFVPSGIGIDLHGVVTVKQGNPVLNFDLPARLRFAPQDVGRLYFPQGGALGLGVAIKSGFFSATPYLSSKLSYPNAFMDFCEMKGSDGGLCALFGVRPRPPHESWKNPREFEFVPGSLGCGGDASGGYVDHAFMIWADKGQTLRLPAVRFAFGLELQDAIDAYSAANDITRSLSKKIAPEKLYTLKRSLLFKITDATAKDISAEVSSIPVPSLVHITQYLKGSFDKEYPDHLPTHPVWFGSDANHRALIDALHAHGHLYLPYTNPTWWCDHPRGPTFLKCGEAPLSIGLDGKKYHEQYGAADGWQTTFWHPAVQTANRKTVRQFTHDLPADILFQDQCGSRFCHYDFNPAAPSPTAYSEGLLSMIEEDSAVLPLATEDCWDKVADLQTAICGMAWHTIPLRLTDPRQTRLAKKFVPPDLWEFEPLAARLMHDKVLFWMHDLGASVDNPRIFAWILAMGYNMSYGSALRRYIDDRRTNGWVRWLALVQRTVCSRIAGAPLVAWRHDRTPMLARVGFDPKRGEDDGVVEAQWGDVHCSVNLGDVPRMVKGQNLAPYGFYITAPGLVAAALEGADTYVKEADMVWRFSDFSCKSK